MSYEYEFKEYMREEILSKINHMNILDDALEELDHVYAQAPKADEYEAKAKAFDEIFKLYIGYEDGWIHFPKGNRSFIEGVTNVCKKYESGETDAKK